MSYADEYYELHKDEFDKNKNIENIKARLCEELTYMEKISIMFADFMKTKSMSETVEIGKKNTWKIATNEIVVLLPFRLVVKNC